MIKNKYRFYGLAFRALLIWRSGFWRGYRRGERIWKKFSKKEIERVRRECADEIAHKEAIHAEERKKLISSADESKNKLRQYKENIDRNEAVSGSMVSIFRELNMNTSAAFQRAVAVYPELEFVIKKGKALAKKMGEIGR
jgi:hypothetical protein